MEKYNREFLVPCLEDVCAIHITDYFLAYKLYETQRQIIVFQHGEDIEPPEKTCLKKFWGFFTALITAIGAFEFFCWNLCFLEEILGSQGVCQRVADDNSWRYLFVIQG